MKRVIWELEDGRKKYSVDSNGPEVYSDAELTVLEMAIKKTGGFGFTKDFGLFGPYHFLKKSWPDSIKITGKILEDADLPLTEGVIL
jgi:hypothetical protein